MKMIKAAVLVDGEDGPHMRRCSRCGKTFGSRRATNNHIRDFHKKRGAKRISARYSDRHPEWEPSLADQVLATEVAIMLSEPVGPMLALMCEIG